MRTSLMAMVACLATAVSVQSQPVKVTRTIDLEPVEGFGPFFPPLGGAGPAGDPVGGPTDLTGDTLLGVPDSLHDLDVRFLNFHYDQGQFQLRLAGGQPPNRATPDHATAGLTTQYVDQQVHYAVGRDANDDFVWIVDTDNDEDLSDETAQVLPWAGPRMSMQTFQDSVMNGPDPAGFIQTMPSVRVTGQVFDGGQVLDVSKLVYLVPFLEVSYESPAGTISKPFYWIAFDGHYEGTIDEGGRTYRIWVRSASNSGLVEPNWTHIRVKDVTDGETEWSDADDQANPAPYRLGDVVQLGDTYFRLDDVDPLGKSIDLVEVSNPNAGLAEGSAVPQFSASTLDGTVLSPGSMKGRFFLLSFWSTRNTSFRSQLDKVYSNYSRSCVEFVTVLDDDAESAHKIDWLGIPWPMVADRDQPESLQDLFDVSRHPTFVLVDPIGRVRAWQSLGTNPFRTPKTPLEIVTTMETQLGPSCIEVPETADVLAVLDANPQWTHDAPWYVDGCSFTADHIDVLSIGPDANERGWPVKLRMTGTCTPTGTDAGAETTVNADTLLMNTILYKSLGAWSLVADDPFIE